MLVIDYESREPLLGARLAIELEEPFTLIVRKGKEELERAIFFHHSYFEKKAQGRFSLASFFKFGYYGLSTPDFWIIRGLAERAGMKMEIVNAEDSLVATFSPDCAARRSGTRTLISAR